MKAFFATTVSSVSHSGRGTEGAGGAGRGTAGARLALYYAAIFAGPGVTLPFLPAFLAARGLSPSGVAAALAVQQLCRLAAGPLIGRVADQTGRRSEAAAVAAAIGVLAGLALLAASGPMALILACGLAGMASSPLAPLGDAMALRAASLGLCDFGRVRGLGSISFVVATLAGGVAVRHLGVSVVPLAMAAGFASAVIAALSLPDLATARARGRGLGLGLLRNRNFLLLLLASGLIQGSHALHYGFSVLYWDSAGIPADLSGVLWTIGVVAEIGLLVAGRRGIGRLGPAALLGIGGVAGAVRWVVTAATTEPWIIGPVQALHALSFAATMLGAAGLLARLVPPELGATAQTLHAALGPGLGMLLLTAASGPLYGWFGGLAFLAMTAACLAALIPAALLARRGEGRG
jgi:PPP family 3-phenylpropionic acid transporter